MLICLLTPLYLCRMPVAKALLFSLLTLFISGCGALIDRISSPDVNPPAPLVDFVPKIRVQPVWQASVGADKGGQYLGLSLIHI